MIDVAPRGTQAGLFYETLFWRPDDDPPIVLLPGLLSDGRQVRRLLREIGRKAIVLDPLGSGRSETPSDPGEYLLPALVPRLYALLDALDIRRADLVGLSMGGMWAQEVLFADAKQRFRGAVLVGTCGGVSPRLRSTLLGLRALWQHDLPRLDAWRILQTLLFSPDFLERPSTVPLLELLASEPKTLRPAALAQLNAILAFAPTENQLRGLAEKRSVCAVVGAALDVLMPPIAQRELAARLGGTKVQLIEQAGHAIWIEQPAALAGVIKDALLLEARN